MQAKTNYKTHLAALEKDEGKNILLIGNSFTRDTYEYMGEILEEAGYKNVYVGLMQISSASLNKIWKKIRSNAPAFQYRVMHNHKVTKLYTDARAEKIFGDRDWDIVILQPDSSATGDGYGSFFVTVDSLEQMDEEEESAEASEETEPEEESAEESEENESEEDSAEDAEETESEEESAEAFEEAESEDESETSFGGAKKNWSFPSWEESTTESAFESEEESESISDEESAETEEAETEVSEEEPGTSESEAVTSEAAETGGDSSEKVCILDLFAEYIHTKNPKAKVGLEMTWAYAKDYRRHGYFAKFDYSQKKMYRTLCKVFDKLAENSQVDFLVPVGTAVENVRRAYFGDDIQRDGCHLTFSSGRVLAALTALSSCGIDISDVTEVAGIGSSFSVLHLPTLKKAARYAVKSPYAVTKIAVKCPTLKKPVLTVRVKEDAVKLTWESVKGATGYIIQRKKGSGSYQRIAELEETKTAYIDRKIAAGKRYTYRIVAVGDDIIANVKSKAVTCKTKREDKEE